MAEKVSARPADREVQIRSLETADLEAAAAVVAVCTDCNVAYQRDLLERRLARSATEHGLSVAAFGTQIVGVARLAYFEPKDGAPSNAAPSGWYLLGLNVLPDQRRRGVGRALTRARLDWIRGRSRVAWFFTDASNEASIRLHEDFGFRRNTKDFWFPTATFGAEGGLLFSLSLSP